jgi:hypothetical protein
MVLNASDLSSIPGLIFSNVQKADSPTSNSARESKNLLVFSDGFKGSKEDRYTKLIRRMRPITPDNGAFIESPMSEEGVGKTVQELVEQESKAFENVEEFQGSNISVLFHYAAYLKDELDHDAFDHSYSGGIIKSLVTFLVIRFIS